MFHKKNFFNIFHQIQFLFLFFLLTNPPSKNYPPSHLSSIPQYTDIFIFLNTKNFRYTFFIVLYPLGASGEVITMLAALPEIAQRKHFTYEMPNSLNFAFNFYYVVIFLCLIYLPGFPQLYGYMFLQRKKVLGSSIKKTN